MGNCCCCSIQIMITKRNNKTSTLINYQTENSVHNRQQSSGSRAFEIIDEKILELYRTKIVNSGSSSSTHKNSDKNSYTTNKITPININNPTNIRKSFSQPNLLNTLNNK